MEEYTTIPRARSEFVGKRICLVGKGTPGTEVVEVFIDRRVHGSDNAREALRAVVPRFVIVADGDDNLAHGEVALVGDGEVEKVEGGDVGDLEDDFVESSSQALRGNSLSGSLGVLVF